MAAGEDRTFAVFAALDWHADLPALEEATAALLSQLRARFHQANADGTALVQDACAVA